MTVSSGLPSYSPTGVWKSWEEFGNQLVEKARANALERVTSGAAEAERAMIELYGPNYQGNVESVPPPGQNAWELARQAELDKIKAKREALTDEEKANYLKILNSLEAYGKLNSAMRDFVDAVRTKTDQDTIVTGSALGDTSKSDLISFLGTAQGAQWFNSMPRWQFEEILNLPRMSTPTAGRPEDLGYGMGSVQTRFGKPYGYENTPAGVQQIERYPALGFLNLGANMAQTLGLRGTARGEQATREYGALPTAENRWGRLPQIMGETKPRWQNPAQLAAQQAAAKKKKEEEVAERSGNWTFAPPARWLTY